MPTITVTSLLVKASGILNDAANGRWSVVELLGWFNEGQREIVGIKPDAYTKNVAVQLVAGAKQTLPLDAIALLDITRNMGVSGVAPGRSLRRVDRRLLDAQLPSWTSGTPAAEAIHFMYQMMDTKVFYVYPPQPAAPAFVEMEYTASVADITDSSLPITLDDTYGAVLLDWILYRAFMKDTDSATDTALAATRLAQFNAALGQKAAGELATTTATQKPGAS